MTEEQIELLTERLVERINKANIYFYKKIGSAIKQIKELTPTQAYQLSQILKYGGSYEEIIKEISKYTNLNIQDIDDIFRIYAEKDQLFYEKFYKYRNIPFIPIKENTALRNQVQAFANIVKKEMYDYTKQNLIGFTINGKFMNIKDTYNYVIDEAVLNVSQGKETFDEAMRQILKDIGGSGLKTVDYKSGRKVRLDSTIRTHLKSELREVHNELQEVYGKEFGADGIEITAHENPAIDHAPVQGLQFSKEEFNKLQNGEVAQEYNSKKYYTLDHDGKNGYRPISQMNCYHIVFSIVLGVSKPAYTKEELQQIIDRNNKGFEYEGKHYTMYEGEQLLRQVERKIREQKDIQILAKESNDKDLILESQQKITQLTQKYKEICNVSGLPPKRDRLSVSGYSRVAKSKLKWYN